MNLFLSHTQSFVSFSLSKCLSAAVAFFTAEQIKAVMCACENTGFSSYSSASHKTSTGVILATEGQSSLPKQRAEFEHISWHHNNSASVWASEWIGDNSHLKVTWPLLSLKIMIRLSYSKLFSKKDPSYTTLALFCEKPNWVTLYENSYLIVAHKCNVDIPFHNVGWMSITV